MTAPTTRVALAAPATHRTPPLALPRTHCNTAMPTAAAGEITKIVTGVQRPGSDHKAIRSRGVGC